MPIVIRMNHEPTPKLRRGWTTGACAAAAAKAALEALWGGLFPERVQITLPRGETPVFAIVNPLKGEGWTEVGIVKDAGDDPDVTHGCEIRVRVQPSAGGVQFRAGNGVGIVTKPGLPVPVGEPAINPAPRKMIITVIEEQAIRYGESDNITVFISIPGGESIAEKTWNPRLGIKGGLSILGTTGIVRPFSCAAWIASIHRGVDVARASGLEHVAGCTGSTSEKAVRALYDLSEGAMLDMGDFAGGLLKYLRRHPVQRLTIGGGIGKLAKLAQGALDLHSARTQVDFTALASLVDDPRLKEVNTVLEAFEISGKPVAKAIADKALVQVKKHLKSAPVVPDIVIVDRVGSIIARAG